MNLKRGEPGASERAESAGIAYRRYEACVGMAATHAAEQNRVLNA